MGWKLVLVPSYEADPAPPGSGEKPPGIWGGAPIPVPTPPIHYPPEQPPGVWPPAGVVSPPIYYPPGIWPPPGVVSPPIFYPPEIWPKPPAGGGTPPGIWPPPGTVSPPIFYPPEVWPKPPTGGGGAPGVPTHPIYNPGTPTHPIVEPPLGIWGGGSLPWPTPPIHYPPAGGPPEGVPPVGGYPGYPAPDPSPIFDPDDMPEHPELPDLNSGYWMKAYDPTDRVIFNVFVAGPVSDNPEEPVNRTPGDWVVVRGAHDGLPAWAWRPETVQVDNSLPGDQPHPDHGLPADQPVVDPRR